MPSMSRNAPTIGEPSRVLMAAKLPADASTAFAWSGTGRLARRTARTASPPPSAISGISGPSTSPKHSVASAARTTPGNADGAGAPCTLKPPAGDAPPLPGRYLIARPASTPPASRTGSGHQRGVLTKPRPCGSRVNSSFCR